MKTKSILKTLVIIFFLISASSANGQESKKLYDPSLNGMKQISEAIARAGKEGKNVWIQYGGNWCSWCVRFDAFCKADSAIGKIIAENYIPVKLNYDPANKNDEANSFLGNPARFGFPVFIVVDSKGHVIHIQDSGLLEEGKGYSKEKVTGFFTQWTPAATVPKLPGTSQPKK
jgi:thioredoxin-related protein